jgi:ABC-type transport system involved in multi-copper enzyme maturation permease subunit
VAIARASGSPELTVQLGVSQILIFIAFQFSFVLAMTAAFLGSPAIASDLESGVALALLARPLRRTSYLLGRWLGLAIVLIGGAGHPGDPGRRVSATPPRSPPVVYPPKASSS